MLPCRECMSVRGLAGRGGGGDAVSLPSFFPSCRCAANTGIVNHTHSRMGSIMSTGIVQGNAGVGACGPPATAPVWVLMLPGGLGRRHPQCPPPAPQGPRVPRVVAAAAPAPTTQSIASSPWAARPSPWRRPCPSRPTPCTTGARRPSHGLTAPGNQKKPVPSPLPAPASDWMSLSTRHGPLCYGTLFYTTLPLPHPVPPWPRAPVAAILHMRPCWGAPSLLPSAANWL